MTPEDVLHETFGFPAFRGLQSAAVHHVVDGGDALILMPTGGGKSVCYQVPALCRAGTGLVVSPLIALMDDQVAALRQLGINAGALHSELEPNEASRVSNLLDSGKLDLLYVSPERLLSPGTLERLRRQQLALIAIDEAHCVSAWGHEFRPEYRALQRLAEIFPGVPRVALTATADPRTRDDILASLDMRNAEVFTASFHRTNLNIAAAAKSSESTQMLEFLKQHNGEAGIIYCGSRAKTDRTALKLREKGVEAIAFHAGLAPIEKTRGFDTFSRRGGGGCGGDHRVRHGDRPARCAVRDAPGYAGQPGGLLPADRPRRPRWRSGVRHAVVWRRGYGAGAALAGAVHRAGSATTHPAAAAGSHYRHRRSHLVPHAGAAAVFSARTSPSRAGTVTIAAIRARCSTARTSRRRRFRRFTARGQMFGGRHIVDVLRGETTDAVARNRHEQLALFGIGRDRSADFWKGVLRQLVARGALRVKSGEYASLELVQETARPILRGETAVMLAEEAPAAEKTRAPKARRGVTPSTGAAPSPQSDSLFDALRVWRMDIAKAQAVPPYVIFHDTVLRDIAAVRPGSRAELADIKGVGASKLDRYAGDVLDIVGRYQG